jgi:hypothetical protein
LEAAAVITVLYKPWSILFGVLGGIIASRVFAKVWGMVADDEAPRPTQRDASWVSVLSAAFLEGAIYAVVKAAAQRGSAQAFEHSTGVWPGEKQSDKASH